MTEILTESFCERCGTRYTFESAVPSQRRLSGLKVLGRGLKNFVMSDDASLDESIAAARSDIDRDVTNHQLDAFHQTFSFCMSCRQYTCANCWNETEARCLSCEPLAIEFVADGAVPEEIDHARLLRFMGENAPRPESGTDAPPEHDDVEAPAAHVHDPWPVEPAARVAWPEGFASASNGSAEFEPEPLAETLAEPPADVPSLDAYAAEFGTTPVDAWAANGQAVPADVDDWAAAEASAEDLTVAAADVSDAAADVTAAEVAAADVSDAAADVTAAEVAAADVSEAAAEVAAAEVAADESIRSEPADVAAADGAASDGPASVLAEHETLSDALAAYEAAFVEPRAEAPLDEIPVVAQVSADGAEMAAPETQPEAEVETQPEAQAEAPAPEAPVEPAIAAVEAEPVPQSIIPTLLPEPAAAASPEPAVEPEPVAPSPPQSPARPTDQVAQPVWRAPADPTGPSPQWPTGPRWPTGIPTGGSPTPQPAPVDQLAALMARTSTEAMWAASSQEILQPASAAPAVAGIRSCGNCGISLSATARFCRRCGTAQG